MWRGNKLGDLVMRSSSVKPIECVVVASAVVDVVEFKDKDVLLTAFLIDDVDLTDGVVLIDLVEGFDLIDLIEGVTTRNFC